MTLQQEQTESAPTNAHPDRGINLRVYTLGPFQVEWVDPATGQAQPLPAERLSRRGAAPSLALFKALLGCPDRYAQRDWLCEQFWPDSSARSARDRLDDVASLLRMVLRPEGNQDKLLYFVADSSGRGSGYRLDRYPHLWCDADALDWSVQQAARMERFGDDPLPFWQRAYELASRGMYLPEQLYEDWTRARREETQGHLRQVVHALSRLSLERFGVAGEEEALLVLRSYWQSHPTDEDALRPLLELLGKRERFQEALHYYARLEEVLAEEGSEPDERTRDIVAYLRAKQVQRPPQSKPGTVPTFEACSPLHIEHVPLHLHHTQFFPPPTQPGTSLESTLFVERASILIPSAFAQTLALEIAQEDEATRLGIRLAHILSLVHHWSKQPISCDILQALIHREMVMFDDTQKTAPDETLALSRRQALLTLAALPTMMGALMQTQPLSLVPEEFLPQCAASMTACWHLARGQEFLLIEKILARSLPILADLAHHPSAYQTTAAGIASQGYRLMGLLALHRNNPVARTAYFDQAVHFAEIHRMSNLFAVALISRAYYDTEPKDASFFYQRGLAWKDDLSPLLLSRLYARLAVVSAQQANADEALQFLQLAQESYPAAPENDPTYFYADFSPASFAMEQGLTYLTLAQQTQTQQYAQRAWEIFEKAGHSSTATIAPARISYEIVNHQAGTALALNDLEAFCHRLELGVSGARVLKSEQRRQEALCLYKDARALWPHEARLQPLADLFLA